MRLCYPRFDTLLKNYNLLDANNVIGFNHIFKHFSAFPMKPYDTNLSCKHLKILLS